MSAFQPLIDAANKFREDRDWRQFHKPKDLALSLVLEAAEVLEHFQWKDGERLKDYLETGGKAEIKKELADVLIYLFFLAEDLGIDLDEAVLEKLVLNAKKYPIDLAKGRSEKYTSYQRT